MNGVFADSYFFFAILNPHGNKQPRCPIRLTAGCLCHFTPRSSRIAAFRSGSEPGPTFVSVGS